MDYNDFGDDLKIQSYTVESLPMLWESFNRATFAFVNDDTQWNDIKYMNSDGTLSNAVSLVDNTKGGIYVFYINPDIIPGIHKGIMYIGRAQVTVQQNIRKRIGEYYRDFVANTDGYKKRRKVSQIFRHWANYIHVRYLLLDDNAIIKAVEKELIKVIRPPFNDDIPTIRLMPTKSGEEVFAL